MIGSSVVFVAATSGLLIDEEPGRGSSLSIVEFESPAERRRRTAVRAFVPESSRINLPQSRARSGCPELDCLRGRLPPGTLAAAEQRATALGIGADRVLIASGAISEDDYVRALAGWLQVPFERLDIPRAACPLPDDRLLDAVNAGLLPLRVRCSDFRIGMDSVGGLVRSAVTTQSFRPRQSRAVPRTTQSTPDNATTAPTAIKYPPV